MLKFRPNTPCTLIRSTKTFDAQGRQKLSSTRIKTKCSIIDLTLAAEDTTVRTDSSATRGRSEERTAPVKLMFKVGDDIRLGDVVEVTQGAFEPFKAEVVYIFRRPAVSGRVHHIEVGGEFWASE